VKTSEGFGCLSLCFLRCCLSYYCESFGKSGSFLLFVLLKLVRLFDLNKFWMRLIVLQFLFHDLISVAVFQISF